MLVLTRRLSEALYIGSNICVTVVRVDGRHVRLGIDAPREVQVLRAELVPRYRSAKQSPARPRTSRPETRNARPKNSQS
jgi:carbon storage regulator